MYYTVANFDFNQPNVNGVLLLSSGTREAAVFSANGDTVSQEGDEVITLTLVTNQAYGDFPFFRDELLVTIQDGTSECFHNLLIIPTLTLHTHLTFVYPILDASLIIFCQALTLYPVATPFK